MQKFCPSHGSLQNTVVCRPISRKRPRNKQLYNHCYIARHRLRKQARTRQMHCNKETVFSARYVPRCYKQGKLEVAVVGGDEKGSLKSETIKYGLKSQGTWTRERLCWQGPAAHTKDRPDLSSERAHHKNKTVTVTQVIKIWS
jgi:hypothetical protein